MVAPSSQMASGKNATTNRVDASPQHQQDDENDVGISCTLMVGSSSSGADKRHKSSVSNAIGTAQPAAASSSSATSSPESAPSTPSSSSMGNSGNIHDDNPHAVANAKLEERVQELELKLATLSLVLQQQHRRMSGVSRTISPTITPPVSPPAEGESVKRATPALDSPAPPDRHLRSRNLSYRLLYENEDAISKDNDSRNSRDIPFMPNQANLNDGNRSGSINTDLLSERTTATMALQDDEKRTSAASSSSTLTAKEETHNATKKFGRKRSDSLNTTDARGKWLDYLNSFQESTHDVDQQMEEFIKVPGAVEALLSYGFWICVDSFLYVLTILPIRFVWSCLLLINYMFGRLLNWKSVHEGPFHFHRRHVYQLIQVSIIYSVYKYVLMPVSIGKLYHWIRGQSMVKLYVLIAIVEVFDRLMCSMGQDCLDSLYWNTTRRPRSWRMAISIAVVLVYTTFHSCLLFIHVATLNVAMNSADQALLTLLISGNFAEIKSTVFKKYNKPNLFKITASDICERFKLALFLGLVLILNISQGMDQPMVWSYIQMCGIVWCAEWLADWIKHSFITKFNFIPSTIYPEYALLLAGDVTGFGHEGVNMDHSHAVVRRIGLAQLPLVCVMARYVREAIKYASDSEMLPLNWQLILGMLVLWGVIVAWKMSLGSFLHRISQAKLKAAPAFSKVSNKKKTK